MGRSHTTLRRELQRNTGRLGYRYQQAQHLAEHWPQEKKPKAVKLPETVSAYIQGKLQAWWTQEKIRGRLQLEQAISISPETVFRFVLKDKRQGGQLSRGLRHKAKSYRQGYGPKDYRGIIPGRVESADPPAVVPPMILA